MEITLADKELEVATMEAAEVPHSLADQLQRETEMTAEEAEDPVQGLFMVAGISLVNVVIEEEAQLKVKEAGGQKEDVDFRIGEVGILTDVLDLNRHI